METFKLVLNLILAFLIMTNIIINVNKKNTNAVFGWICALILLLNDLH